MAKVLLLDNHVSFGNIVFGLASARPTPQGLSGAPFEFEFLHRFEF